MNAFVRLLVLVSVLCGFASAASAQDSGFSADGGVFLRQYMTEGWHCGPDGQWKNVIVYETVAAGILSCGAGKPVSTIYPWGSTPEMLRNGYVIGYIYLDGADLCISKPAVDYMTHKAANTYIYTSLSANQKKALDLATNKKAKTFIIESNSGHLIDCTPFMNYIVLLRK